ncbi:hypothetical protein ATCV1_Z523L [Acanthocystis turfacea chlorella virus 1]|uniref:Uncharacterized protein Z523L n=1 Tax=Chlorovirus heliozoae TaxID=322019 RepID=A7K9D3_9PHYC|nr:hypothetical protein ATCV1_Z523L [Acanthocystis turfacea chlorella virus 1]ABT16657.1 hypothetical protein ATCV1_Z523L [Acanthocystis turfacea chlorella virus 1]
MNVIAKLMEISQMIETIAGSDGKRKILFIAQMFWIFQWSLSFLFICVAIFCGETGSKLGPALLVAWQLMATQMLVCSNKLHEYAMLVENNSEYIKGDICSLVIEHRDILNYNITEIYASKEYYSSEYLSCLTNINITCNIFTEKLRLYYDSLSWWRIITHILSWKSSPDITHWLEKDSFNEKILKEISRIKLLK